jgi:hypothetical protein
MKFLIFLISLSIFAIKLSAQQDAPKAAKITAKSGLNMRAKPDFQSQSYGVIQYDKKVKVLKWGSDQNQIQAADGTYGFWVKAQYGNKIGYLFSTYIEADWAEYTPRTTTEKAYVIAASGLKLRQKPSANAGVIKSVPYNSEVVVLENHAGEENYQYTDAEGISGSWLKVKVGADIGFLFGGYVTTATFVKPGKFNSKYRLEYWSGCSSDINYDPKMNWHAMFRNDNDTSKSIYQFESVKLKLLGAINELTTYTFSYSQEKQYEDRGIYPQFFIGSVKPLKPVSQAVPSNTNMSIAEFDYETGLPINGKIFAFKNLKIKLLNTEKVTMSGTYGSATTIFKRTLECEVGGKKQILNPYLDLPKADYPSGESITLDYYGDLDADGLSDLIITYNNGGEGSTTLLYLSSEAEPGELWKLVSYRASWSCC